MSHICFTSRCHDRYELSAYLRSGKQSLFVPIPPIEDSRYHGQPLWWLSQARITSMMDYSQSYWQSPYTP